MSLRDKYKSEEIVRSAGNNNKKDILQECKKGR
jgi:hypothetical protein